MLVRCWSDSAFRWESLRVGIIGVDIVSSVAVPALIQGRAEGWTMRCGYICGKPEN